MHKLTIRPLAEMDLGLAFNWYEIQNPGMGLKATQSTLSVIKNNPLQFQVKHAKVVRSARISRFPYSIHYIVDNNRIIILGFLHHKRNPKIWKKRKS